MIDLTQRELKVLAVLIDEHILNAVENGSLYGSLTEGSCFGDSTFLLGWLEGEKARFLDTLQRKIVLSIEDKPLQTGLLSDLDVYDLKQYYEAK